MHYDLQLNEHFREYVVTFFFISVTSVDVTYSDEIALQSRSSGFQINIVGKGTRGNVYLAY